MRAIFLSFWFILFYSVAVVASRPSGGKDMDDLTNKMDKVAISGKEISTDKKTSSQGKEDR